MRLFFLVILITFLLNGCKDDPCKQIVCENGNCLNGNCLCLTGYEGKDCSIKSVVKFIGTWYAIDDCDPDMHQYTAAIAASATTTNQLMVTNFAGLGSNTVIIATIDGADIIINSQEVGNGNTVEGSGSISIGQTQIQFSYTITDLLGDSTNCEAIWNL